MANTHSASHRQTSARGLVRRSIALLAGAGGVALCAGAVQAQQAQDAPPAGQARIQDQALAPSPTLGPVVVSATRTERDPDDLPATISAITAEEIEDMLADDIKDLVRFEPGVAVRSSPARFTTALAATGRDGNSGFNIRGLEGNRVLIQTDGVRLPDAYAFGAQSVGRGDYLDLDLLKSVEILRGPASALYGSDGLAGAVSFTTRDPDDLLRAGQDFGGRARVSYSSADEGVGAGVAAAGRIGAWQGLIAMSHRTASEQENKGTDESLDSRRTAPNPQDIDSNTLLGKIVYAPSDAHRLRLTVEHFDRNVDSAVYSGRTPPAVPPATLPPTAVTNLDASDRTERDRVSLDYTFLDEEGFIERAFVSAYYQDSTTIQKTFEERLAAPDRARITTFDNRVWGAAAQLETSFLTGAVQHRVLVGGDYSSTRQEGIRDGTVPPVGETFPARAFPNTDYVLAGLFVQDEISLLNGSLLLYPALRYDYYDLSPEADALYPLPVAGHDNSRLSPKLGGVFWVSDVFGAFANYAAGFKAPTPSQVNNGFGNPIQNYISIANPDLGPETSHSFEAGLRLRDVAAAGAIWSASATAFTADYTDFIEQVMVGGSFTPADPAVFQFVNLNDVTISGFEARAEGQWGNGIGVIAAFSYAKGDSETNGVKEPLQSIEPWKLAGGVSYRDPLGRFGGQAIVTHSSGKEDARVAQNRPGDARADLFTPDGFTIMDVTAYWNVTDAATLRVGVFNVFDEKYWWWGDVRGVADTSPILDAYTQPGRNFSASLIYRF